MSTLFTSVLAAFDAASWAYERVPDHDEVIQAQFEAHHTRVPIHVQVFSPIHALHVVATAPHAFESFHLMRLSELLMRSSQELTIGGFDMDWEGRRVLYRVSNLFDLEQGVSKQVVQAMVHAAIVEMDRITPLLTAIYKTDGRSVLLLDIPSLMAREDWLPPALGSTDDDGIQGPL